MSPSTPPVEPRRPVLNPNVTSPERGEPSAGDDCPSTLLLRELQGSNEGPASPHRDETGPLSARHTPRIHDPRDVPTPTRTRPTYSLESSSSSEDEGPPKSIMYGDNEGERTPRSPEGALLPGRTRPGILPTSDASTRRTATFRQVDAVPSGARYERGRLRRSSISRSPSRSRSRSRSPSPGPSSISAYASGLESTVADSVRPSETETSPGAATSNVPRRVPTFREPTGVTRNASPSRSSRPPHDYSRAFPTEDRPQRQGYLDPPVPPPGAARKGKPKAKQSGGRRYEATPAEEESHNLDQPPDEVHRKVGMNDYEKALWKWVNVEDLDGFLQEVRTCFNVRMPKLIVARSTSTTKARGFGVSSSQGS